MEQCSEERLKALLRLPLFDLSNDPLAAHKRLVACAKRGINDPTKLSTEELKQVCYALTLHYAQMGLE